MSKLTFIILFFISFRVYPQKDTCWSYLEYDTRFHKDTLRIEYDSIKYIKHSYNRSLFPTRYYIDDVLVDSLYFYQMKNKIQSSKKTFEKAEYHYCIISINGKPFLETYLAGDLFFYGYTKLYDENGNIKEEGMYSDNSCSLTKKTGVWKYYLDTRIIRIEEYDTKGNLLNAKSF